MHKTMTGLLGAVAALGALGATQAAPASDPSDALKVSSFAELLEPIPDAATQLKVMDEAQSKAPAERNIQLAYHHHHHHHWRHRHHHHHHHWR
jgi:hypothetical protein